MHIARAHPRRPALAALLACVLLCLPVAAAASSRGLAQPASNNPYDARLRALQSEFGVLTPARQGLRVRQGYGLREYLDQRAALGQWLAALAADRSLHPLVRDEAGHHAALLELHSGELEAAQTRWAALGFVTSWSAVGPFAFTAPGPAELDASLGPEQGWDPAKTYADAGGQRAWRELPAGGPQPWADLAHIYTHSGAGAAFLASAVHSERARPAALRFAADSALAVWVNGVRVLRLAEQPSFAFDQNTVGVELQAGWNTILVKLIHRGEGPWRFAMRVTEPEGGGLSLRVSVAEGWRNRAATAGARASVPAADLLRMARPEAAGDLYTLGLWQQAMGFRAAAEQTLEAAARRHPSAERWLALAAVCRQDACRLNALNAALRLEAENATALTALAAYYRGRQQTMKAAELLRRAVRLSPHDFVARAELAALVSGDAAQAIFAALEREFPQPLWLRRRLAAHLEQTGQIARALDVAAAALRGNFDGEEERVLLERLYQRRRDSAALSALYEQSAQLWPADPAPRLRLAALLAGAGEAAAAEATLRQALEAHPEHAGLQRQLAEVLAASGRGRDARTQLARALQANPHLSEVRRLLQAAPARNWQEQDASYVVNAARLAAVAQRGALPRARAIALADVRVQRVLPSGLSVLRVQQVMHLSTDSGAREFAQRSVQYAPATQRLEIIAARIHKPDGSQVEAVPAGESSVHDLRSSLYYDVRSHTLRFPGLARGDVLELDYRITPVEAANPWGDYFGDLVLFGSSLPRRLQRYVLITPAARRYNIVEERMPVAAQVETRDGSRIHRWEARNLRPIPFEPRGPALAELAPFVLVSRFRSWEELGEWYAGLLRPQMAADAEVRATAARLTQGKHTDSEKIQAIHHFILRQMQYVGLEFGIHSYKPYPVSQTLARRFGDCKDKASLMVALLEAAGIHAEMALVRTRRAGEVGERAHSIHIFNHAVVYIPEHELWLDGTAEYAGSRELPVENEGALAFTVALDGRSRLHRIPARRPEDNHTRRSVRAEVGEDGVVRFAGLVYTRGHDAPGLRRQYEVEERQREALRTHLAAVVPSIRVEDVRVAGALDLEHDVSVEFRGALHSFEGRRSISLGGSWMPRSYVEQLASRDSRTQDLLLPSPWSGDEEIVFALPAGATVSSMPEDAFLETPFGTASLKYEQRPGEVVVRSSVEFRAVRVTPAEYRAFRRFCEALEEIFKGEVRVELAAPGVAQPPAAVAAGELP